MIIKVQGMVYMPMAVLAWLDYDTESEELVEVDRIFNVNRTSPVVPIIQNHGEDMGVTVVGEITTSVINDGVVFVSGEVSDSYSSIFKLIDSRVKVPVSIGVDNFDTEIMEAGSEYRGQLLKHDTILLNNAEMTEVSIVDTPAINSAFIQKI